MPKSVKEASRSRSRTPRQKVGIDFSGEGVHFAGNPSSVDTRPSWDISEWSISTHVHTTYCPDFGFAVTKSNKPQISKPDKVHDLKLDEIKKFIESRDLKRLRPIFMKLKNAERHYKKRAMNIYLSAFKNALGTREGLEKIEFLTNFLLSNETPLTRPEVCRFLNEEFFESAGAGYLEIVKFLDQSANVNVQYYFRSRHEYEIWKSRFFGELDFNRHSEGPPEWLCTPLHEIAMYRISDIGRGSQPSETAKYLTDNHLLDVNAYSRDADGQRRIITPLQAAAWTHRHDLVKILLGAGANPNLFCSVFPYPPIHLAILSLESHYLKLKTSNSIKDAHETVKLLIDVGARLNAPSLKADDLLKLADAIKDQTLSGILERAM